MSQQLALAASALLVLSYYLPSLAARLGAPRSKERHLLSKLAMYAVYALFYAAFANSLLSSEFAFSALSILGFVLALAGVFFHHYAVKALGPCYSAGTEFKPGQKLVASGVYSLCRHPLYSAAALFFSGLTLLAPLPPALIAFALVLIYLAYRMRVEERLLAARFGRHYASYGRKVPATAFGWLLKKIQAQVI